MILKIWPETPNPCMRILLVRIKLTKAGRSTPSKVCHFVTLAVFQPAVNGYCRTTTLTKHAVIQSMVSIRPCKPRGEVEVEVEVHLAETGIVQGGLPSTPHGFAPAHRPSSCRSTPLWACVPVGCGACARGCKNQRTLAALAPLPVLCAA